MDVRGTGSVAGTFAGTTYQVSPFTAGGLPFIADCGFAADPDALPNDLRIARDAFPAYTPPAVTTINEGTPATAPLGSIADADAGNSWTVVVDRGDESPAATLAVTSAGPFSGSHVYAYDPAFTGGVRVALAGVNGDGVTGIITGVGGGPHVKVFDGTKLTHPQADGTLAPDALLSTFRAYDESFRGGVNVAVADVDGDGVGEIIAGSGEGGGPVFGVFRGPVTTGTKAAAAGALRPT